MDETAGRHFLLAKMRMCFNPEVKRRVKRKYFTIRHYRYFVMRVVILKLLVCFLLYLAVTNRYDSPAENVVLEMERKINEINERSEKNVLIVDSNLQSVNSKVLTRRNGYGPLHLNGGGDSNRDRNNDDNSGVNEDEEDRGQREYSNQHHDEMETRNDEIRPESIFGRVANGDSGNQRIGGFQFVSNLGKQVHEKVMRVIERDKKMYTAEVDLGTGFGDIRRHEARRGGGGINSVEGEREGGGGGGGRERGKGGEEEEGGGMAMQEVEMDVKAFPLFVEYADENGPGEHGKDVHIPDESLTSGEREEREAAYKINNFDLWASQLVSLHRRLDDWRDERCRTQQYNMTSLPSVSVVMVFYNEAWTTLLRSVHSVLDKSPASVLMEVILLDDASDHDHLGEPLKRYLEPMKRVRLVRAWKRLGLIKARNLGFLYTRGDIVVFLDSHIECFPGWLEPLVTPIVLDPRTVTFPLIPTIKKDTFGVEPIRPGAYIPVGTVNIHNLMFDWILTKDHRSEMYIKSPAMPGGLYAISRDWFRHLGGYDPLLRIWGGENVEISFKIWMCGGKILMSRCSWVGHVFRSKSPLKTADFLQATPINTNRIAEVWMDKYKHFFFEKFNYNIGELGDVSLQKDLRRSLQCQNFGWYLKHVNHRLRKQIDSKSVFFGQVTNMKLGKCLALDVTELPTLLKCDPTSYHQSWQLRTSGHLQCYDKVLSIKTHSNTNLRSLTMRPMSTKHPDKLMTFDYDESNRLIHRESRHCLDLDTSSETAIYVTLSPCGYDVTSQNWNLQTRLDHRAFHKGRGVNIEW